MKKCRVCKSKFEPHNSLQFACGPDCALQYAQKAKRKDAESKAKEQRKWVKEQRERLKPRREWVKNAQKEFNAFIRARDAHLPCVCCGEWGPDEDWKAGGRFDAGHFLSVGSHPELRFDESNCHKQLKSCNAGEGKYANKRRTVGEQYRLRLIEKIGRAEVDRLEGLTPPKHYTIDDLKEIKTKYRALARELQKLRAAA